MKELIARLEAATEGSRELDCLVALADGWQMKRIDGEGPSCGDDGVYWKKGDWSWTQQDFDEHPPNYSTSVDAALTLVPEGCAFYRLDQYHDDKSPAWGWGAKLRCPATPSKGIWIGESRATPALALVIASLKARMANPGPITDEESARIAKVEAEWASRADMEDHQ